MACTGSSFRSSRYQDDCLPIEEPAVRAFVTSAAGLWMVTRKADSPQQLLVGSQASSLALDLAVETRLGLDDDGFHRMPLRRGHPQVVRPFAPYHREEGQRFRSPRRPWGFEMSVRWIELSFQVLRFKPKAVKWAIP